MLKREVKPLKNKKLTDLLTAVDNSINLNDFKALGLTKNEYEEYKLNINCDYT